MHSQNATNHVLIDRSPERQIDLLGNTRTAPDRIAPFHLDDSTNNVGIWSLWTGFASPLWRKQQPVLLLDQCTMEIHQRRRFERNGCTNQTSGLNEQEQNPAISRSQT